MFTIFGATGNTGSVAAKQLLKQGQKLRVVVRSASKAASLKALGAEILEGDVTDRGSVERALEGSKGVYLLVPPDPSSNDLVGRGARIVENYVRALERQPVAHVVLLSSIAAHEPSGTGPIVIVHNAEQALATLKDTSLTFIRAAYFMENLLAFAQPMKQDRMLPVFGGGESYPFPMVASRDVGLTAANALLTPKGGTDIVELSGPREYSFADVAAEASAILGAPVTATPVPLEAIMPALTSTGVSENVAGLYREMTGAAGSGTVRFDGTGRAVRGKTPLADVLAALR